MSFLELNLRDLFIFKCMQMRQVRTEVTTWFGQRQIRTGAKKKIKKEKKILIYRRKFV